MELHTVRAISPISEIDRSRPIIRDRKPSVAGNRSWSEEEEAFLLRTRMQKMPYKQIAAQLKKTELACRLHYHQLAHGSHRRRRTSSVCSTSSTRSADVALSMSRYHVNHEYAPITPAHSPRLGSPINTFQGASPANRFNAVNGSPAHVHSSSKILLPKPHLLKQSALRSATPELINSGVVGGPLRINTADAVLTRGASYSVPPQPGRKVNVEKLRAIYESRRQAFWAEIAAEYGTDVSAAELEHVWRYGTHVSRPPTPDDSPDSNVGSVASVVSTDKAPSVVNAQSELRSADRRTSSPRVELPRLNMHGSLHNFAPSAHQHRMEQRSRSEQPQQHHSAVMCSNSAVEQVHTRPLSPVSNVASAVSMPDRAPFVLPTPNLMPRSWAPTSTPPPIQQQQQRSGASTPQTGAPATSISALLNQEKKWPERETSAEPIAVS